MNVTYRRELDRNYLVIGQEEYRDSYQVEMLVRNRIPGFLSCRLGFLDRRADFYYEITSRQSLALVLERKKLSAEELSRFLEGILKAAQACGEYLLDAGRILLNPDYIYLEPDQWEFSFCYFPFWEEDIQDGLLGLAEYLLEHLDRQDQGAVTLGYEFYRMAGEANASLEQSLAEWKEKAAEKQEEADRPSPEPVKIKSETMILERTPGGGLVLKSINPAYPDIHITGDSFLIGKKKGAVDGQIKARGVSRLHGKISREGESYYLTDLNSTNGTFLNGGRLEINEKARLRPGDCVGFADVEYLVEIPGEA